MDRLDVREGVLNRAVGQRRALIGVPGVAVAIRDDEVAVGEGGPDDPREMVGVVRCIQKQFGQRVGVVGVDRPGDGVAVPRLGRLPREDGVGIDLA